MYPGVGRNAAYQFPTERIDTCAVYDCAQGDDQEVGSEV
jgi:hypothetical protein